MPQPILAGTLDQRVTLQARAADRDPLGQPVGAWADVATVWANVRLLAGLEAIRAGADTSTVKASVRIRMRPGIDAGMQLVHAGATYRITAVLPDHSRQTIDLICEASNGAT